MLLSLRFYFVTFLVGLDRLKKMMAENSDQNDNDKAAEINPLGHEIKMSRLRWFRTYLLTPILIPIRILLIFILLFPQWLIARICLIGLSHDDITKKPLVGWRRSWTGEIIIVFGKLFIRYVFSFCTGYKIFKN